MNITSAEIFDVSATVLIIFLLFVLAHRISARHRRRALIQVLYHIEMITDLSGSLYAEKHYSVAINLIEEFNIGYAELYSSDGMGCTPSFKTFEELGSIAVPVSIERARRKQVDQIKQKELQETQQKESWNKFLIEETRFASEF